jgi:hypothetical protein
MNDQNPSSPDRGNFLSKGILYSNIFALIAFALAYFVANWNESAGSILSFSEFVLVPIGMGIIAMKYWMMTRKRLVALLPYAILNTIIGILLSAFFMGEGYICLIIVSPLILGFMWTGVVLGKYVLPKDRTTLKASTLSVLVFLFLYDTFSEHNYTNAVTDQVSIHAPGHRVWKYVAAHPVNSSEADYWLFTVGLPRPMQSTATGDTVGSERKCIFSNGAIFDELVVESERDSIFTFDILKQPEDPEIIGHIEILRGQFILKENADGTTTLIGKSWYKLRVYPVWYYDLWAEDITRKVHMRVMEHIKALAENDV